jgi:nucleotide-binding universal stress UspA family protein
MATLRTLVFGDDGSPGADEAWQWITRQRWPGWRVVVVSAAPPPIGPPVEAALAAPHAWEPPAPRRAPGAAEIAAVEHLTALADPRVVLSEFPGADLVVVGPTGSGVLKSLQLGSTAAWLLDDLTAPVVVARAARLVGPVLVCVDGSPHARRAVESLAGLPWIKGAEVTVLGVDDGRSDAAAEAADAAPLLEAAGATVMTCEVAGKPSRVILDQAEARGAGLIVMGGRGLTRLRRVFIGSTANAVTRGADCSVMVVSAGA